MLDLSKSLKENDVSDLRKEATNLKTLLSEAYQNGGRAAADEIERLRAEVADLTKANVLLHAIVSNREEEISGLRDELASAAATLADIENGLQSAQIRDLEGRLASARKALKVTAAMIHGEMIENAVTDMSTMMTLGDVVQSALTDENGKS